MYVEENHNCSGDDNTEFCKSLDATKSQLYRWSKQSLKTNKTVTFRNTSCYSAHPLPLEYSDTLTVTVQRFKVMVRSASPAIQLSDLESGTFQADNRISWKEYGPQSHR